MVLVRSDDVYMSPAEKVDFANKQNADAFISVHVNAADAHKKDNSSGIEVMVSKDNKQFEQSKLFGSAVLQSLSKDFKTNNNLVEPSAGVWVLKATNLAAVLVEFGYIDNDEDVKNLTDNKKTEQMARAILQAAALYTNNKNVRPKDAQTFNENANTIDSASQPSFPGGADAWKKYLEKSLNLGVLVNKNAPPGTFKVVVSFKIKEDGTITDVEALNNPGYGAAEEAVRFIKEGPKWIPAKQDGKPVGVVSKQVISFRIS